MAINNRRDVLLLLLYSPGVRDAVNEPIIGRTRLVKMIFLFREEALGEFRRGTQIDAANFYEFFAWNFGPFSTEVMDDLNFFQLRGFIEHAPTEEDALPESAAEWEMWLSSSRPDTSDDVVSEYEEEEFRLTEEGCAFAADLYSELGTNQRKLLQEFKARLASTPLKAVLRYVYENYPGQTTKSKIRDSVVGR